MPSNLTINAYCQCDGQMKSLFHVYNEVNCCGKPHIYIGNCSVIQMLEHHVGLKVGLKFMVFMI